MFLINPARKITWYIEFHHYYSYVNNTMRKTKEFSVDLRKRIIDFHKSGNTYSTISNRLAIRRSTEQSVMKKFKQFGTTENLQGRGRKAKLSPTTAQKHCHEVNIKPSVVLEGLAKSLDSTSISVSTRAIQRYLNKNGLYGHRPRQAPLHKPCHIGAQFNFAEIFLGQENCFQE